MPDTIPNASSVFLPWVRQGAAGAIQNAETLSPTQAGRVSVPVKLRVNNAKDVNVTVGLLGPGEVTGLDRQQIVRTEPKPGTTTFESNFLAAIEFDRPDLPWLFTPAKADANGRLRPWLCLIVVKKQPGVSLRSDRAVPLAIVEIGTPAKPGDELPDLAESWAWAHAQISAAETATFDGLKNILATKPELSVSRLLCPRLLQPNTDYLACVVPAFEIGRKVALNEPIPMTDTAPQAPQPKDGLSPAWRQDATQVTLPVFYHWEFRTGPAGDFESLATLLEAREVPPQVGKRPMDVSTPGFKLPASPLPTKILELEGALRVPKAAQTPWPDAQRNAFQQELKKLLNTAAKQPTPLVAPPIYGSVLAGVTQVDNAGSPPRWVDELNLDPRQRVVAALGTRVVQSQQEELMASAWEQMGEIERANQRLRQEQLSLTINTVLHDKHFARLKEDALLQMAAPAQARIVWADPPVGGAPAQMLSLHQRIDSAIVPTAAVASVTRRLTRPRGAVSRRVVVQGVPGGLRIGTSFISTLNRPNDRFTLRTGGAITLNRISETVPQLAQIVRSENATARKILNADDQAPPAKDFKIIPEGEMMPPRRSQPLVDVDNAAARHFRQASATQQARINRLAIHDEVKPRLPLLEIAKSLLRRLDPVETVTLRERATITRAPSSGAPQGTRAALATSADQLRPILAAPDFPQPMYEVLRDLSQELLLPGLQHVPPNTATLLETNPKFVEAFMVGLNTEMGRELLWRGFPTDQRGTYFQLFWEGAQRDIKPIDQWDANPLGENLFGSAPDKNLVLLIRSDLLSRYPNAVIYAAKATGDPREPGPEEKYPIFRGTLQPDITFLGFDLTSEEATKDAGWFFIIQEQPTEPRFGFDKPEDFGARTYVSVALPPPASLTIEPPVEWRKNSAHMAIITRQQPVRVAIHATQMIP
jgi:hypothetical protein